MKRPGRGASLTCSGGRHGSQNSAPGTGLGTQRAVKLSSGKDTQLGEVAMDRCWGGAGGPGEARLSSEGSSLLCKKGKNNSSMAEKCILLESVSLYYAKSSSFLFCLWARARGAAQNASVCSLPRALRVGSVSLLSLLPRAGYALMLLTRFW